MRILNSIPGLDLTEVAAMVRVLARVSMLVLAAAGCLSGCGSTAGNQVSYDNPTTSSGTDLMESRTRTAYDDRGCAMVEGVMR